MYSEFLKFFDKSISYNIYGNDYRTFIIAFGGQQFGKGMFSVFDKGDALVWERRLSKAFPKYKGRFRAFGYDWMGRCFAVPVDNEDSILVFDPGVFDVYEISLGLKDFVNKAIPLTTEECLSAGAFVKWSDSTGTDLGRAECVGYKVPLFLGGHDEIDNFEVIGMDEYWEIISQTGRKLHGIEEEEPVE
ncbi:MAG: DUF1851 domain-containing protein, partial [Firmicutes bacterium]|nr:DUF1851 domain-containing protein [Bacillota bacterium]